MAPNYSHYVSILRFQIPNLLTFGSYDWMLGCWLNFATEYYLWLREYHLGFVCLYVIILVLHVLYIGILMNWLRYLYFDLLKHYGNNEKVLELPECCTISHYRMCSLPMSVRLSLFTHLDSRLSLPVKRADFSDFGVCF